MNITLKLPDDLIREARHLALDENTSLSALVAELLAERLGKATNAASQPKSLLEAMTVPGTPDWFYEREFPLEDRKKWGARDFSFAPVDA